MTLVSAIIADAMRESNLIAVGTTPQPLAQAEALGRLSSLVASVLGFEAGEQYRPWPVGTTGYRDGLYAGCAGDWSRPPANVRLICNLAGSITIWLPVQPDDGARIAVQDLQGNFASNNLVLMGNGRTIEGAQSVTLDEDGANREWFFRADLGDWRRVTSLDLDAEFPFPVEFDDMFITLLAMRLNPRYGRALSEESKSALSRSRGQFQARYRQRREVISNPALLHMSVQTFANDSWRDYDGQFGEPDLLR